MTDPPGHLDLDALADVLAGERDDPHLRSCRTCADRLAELSAAGASTSAALAALPAPPMPDGLSLRLAHALQEERRRELAAVRTPHRRTPRRRTPRRRTPGWLPAVAASAAFVLAGAVGWSLLDVPGGAGQDSATSAAGGSAGGQEMATEAEPEAAADLALPGTGTDWADEAVRGPALAQLLPPAGPAAGSTLAVPPGAGLDRLRDASALAECLQALPGDDEVLAVDEGQYAGTPALAVVRADGPAQVTVTVVAGGCSATDPQVLTVLRLPRP